MDSKHLINKRVLVAGLGVTGWSVIRYLERHQVTFEVADEHADAGDLYDTLPLCILHQRFDATVFCAFDVIVLSPGIPRAHPAVSAAIASGVSVIGDIELFASAVVAPVIAVTGSNGKSTVVAWLTYALNESGVRAAACGNIGTPALDSLQSEAEVLVLELSSYQLESTESLRPKAATVLNISEDHLDRYDDIHHYAKVKRRVYRQTEMCVANRDDEQTWPDAEITAPCRYFSLSTDSGGNRSHWDRSALKGTSIAVPGDHNLANALAVIALASVLDVAAEKFLKALSVFPGLEHRSEFVKEKSGVRWYNDSKGTNVDACKKAIRAMPGPVVLIAGGISKGADFSQLADTVSQYVKLLILIGRDQQIIADQLDGLTETLLTETLQLAVQIASKRAVSGDVVLLSPACSSFDMFDNFEDRGEQFKATVHEVLAA